MGPDASIGVINTPSAKASPSAGVYSVVQSTMRVSAQVENLAPDLRWPAGRDMFLCVAPVVVWCNPGSAAK